LLLGSYVISGRWISYLSIKLIKAQIRFNIFLKNSLTFGKNRLFNIFRNTYTNMLKKLLHSTFFTNSFNISKKIDSTFIKT